LKAALEDFDELQKVLGLEPAPLDRDGRITGVPPDAQVLANLDSPASWGFVAGAVVALSPLLVVVGGVGGWVGWRVGGFVLRRVVHLLWRF
jgi:hypothetical protein